MDALNLMNFIQSNWSKTTWLNKLDLINFSWSTSSNHFDPINLTYLTFAKINFNFNLSFSWVSDQQLKRKYFDSDLNFNSKSNFNNNLNYNF